MRARVRIGVCRTSCRCRHRLSADHARCDRWACDSANVKIIWAWTREVFNVVEADQMGCHIITAPVAILKKLPSLGTKTAAELSLDAVKAFRKDAVAVGLKLPIAASRAAE
jgi:transaldolase